MAVGRSTACDGLSATSISCEACINSFPIAVFQLPIQDITVSLEANRQSKIGNWQCYLILVICCQKNFPTLANAVNTLLSPFALPAGAGNPSSAASFASGGPMSS